MSRQLARRGGRRAARTGAQPESTSGPATARNAAQPLDRLALARQAEQGNQHVQRLVRGSIQRDAAADAPSATVPGLPATVVRDIEGNLASDRVAALAAIVRALSTSGQIDLSFLLDNTMTFVSDTSRMRPGHSGLTSLTPGAQRPRPCRVEIGPDAFQSVSTLYTTVMHEWQHVLQFRRPELSSEPVDELEARLGEIEGLERTGLWRNALYMGRVRGQLDHFWNLMSAEEQTPYRTRYDAALLTIADLRRRLQDEQFAQQQGRK